MPACLVGLVPMWVHIAMVGPSTAFRGMVIDPVFKLRAGRELPRPPSWTHLDGSLQAIAELVPPWWKLPALSAEKSLFLWFFAMLDRPRRSCCGSPFACGAGSTRHGPQSCCAARCSASV